MNVRHILAVAALLAALSPPAFAVNYPTELLVKSEGDDPTKPTLRIGFNNNEGDRVHFNYQVMANGVLWPQFGVDDGIHCIGHGVDNDYCKGAAKSNLRDPWTTSKGWRSVGLGPVNVDADYCIRVIAIDDSGRNSAWTPWGCVHTPPLPRRPAAAPNLPLITLLDAGSDGKGRVGGAVPGKVLVEWTFSASDVTWYSVERGAPGSGSFSEVGRVTPLKDGTGDGEFVDNYADISTVPNVGKPIDYRVCTNNAGGKTCGGARQFPRFSAELTLKSPRALAILAGSGKPTIANATTTVSPAVSLAPPAAPASSAVLRPGAFAVVTPAPSPAVSTTPIPVAAKSAFGGTTTVGATSVMTKSPSAAPTSTFGTPRTGAVAPAMTPATSSARPALDWGKTAAH